MHKNLPLQLLNTSSDKALNIFTFHRDFRNLYKANVSESMLIIEIIMRTSYDCLSQ